MPRIAKPPAATGAVPAALAGAFGVLRRPRTPADDIGDPPDGVPPDQYIAQQTRRLPASPPAGGTAMPFASDAFIAPGPRGTACLLVIPLGADGPGGTCLAATEMLRGDAIWAVRAGGDLSEVIGLVPDGVRSVRFRHSGGTSVLPVRDNTYGALFPGRPLRISYRAPDGRGRSIPFGGG